MEHAFAADCVDETIAGDWEDMQIKLGLLDSRKTKRRYLLWDRLVRDDEVDDAEEWIADNGSLVENAQMNRKKRKAEKERMKNRRAMAKQSRRQNRKKKK